MSLTPKQQRFVDEYLIDLNGKQAAIRAGYRAKSAEITASKLLRNAKVQTAIQSAQQARQQRTEITADRVLQELALVAFGDIGQVLDFSRGGSPRVRSDEIPESIRRCIAAVKIRREVVGDDETPTELVEFRLWPKDSALEKLARHLGLFKDKLTIDLRVKSAQELEDAELHAIAAQARK